jgi:predicted O-linked N-acetylglucosamine transferase (SPINDLY family)
MSAKAALTRAKKKQARTLVDQQRLGEAAVLYEKICAIDPVDAEAWFMLGAIHQQHGQLDRAHACYARAAELDPRNPETLYYLGLVSVGLGRSEAAIGHYRQVLTLQPGHLKASCNLGTLYEQQRRYTEAIECYQAALTRHPREPVLHYNHGCASLALGCLDEAIAHLETTIQIQPEFSAAYTNLGLALERKSRLKDAIACYERGLKTRQPDYLIHNNLASALEKAGRPLAAIAHYRTALGINPADASLRSNYLLALNYLPELAPQDLYAEHVLWGRRHGTRSTAPAPFANSCEPARALRIGYLSPDFRTHSVSYFFEPVLAQHDRGRFETVCYADVARPDATTERLRGMAHQWRDISGMTNDAAAALICADGIDILVDLAGHAGTTRLPVLAAKPAPVQATWLGYPNTSGLPAIDYRLTDALADPDGQETYHTEQLVRLPGGFLCYRPPADAPAVAPSPAAANGYVTFGSFNTLAKITDPVLASWSEILAGLPAAHLIIKNRALGDPYARECFEERLRQIGLPGERVTLSGWATSTAAHLDRYREIDIALDTFPYHGTTTTCEALWMGAPVVTRAGERHAARVGVSLLTRVGLPELIAATHEDYVRIATELGRDPVRLAALRAGLRERVARSPLCDGSRFTRELEDAYAQMWEAWCVRNRPSRSD